MKIAGRILDSIQMAPSIKRDALLFPALFVLNLFIFSKWEKLGHVVAEPRLILVWLYALAVLVPLVWRDKTPVTVFVIQWILTVAAWPFMTLYTPVIGIPVALHSVAVNCHKKTALWALLASVVPIGLDAAVAFRLYSDLGQQLRSGIPNATLLVIVTVGAWGAGRVTRANRFHVERLESERETVREAVAAERSRIARELHDIVSHSVTAIVLQAAGAARVAHTNLAQVVQSLAHIETTGKQAMAELRRLLGVLEASGPSEHTVDGLGPQPGLADMPTLLSSLRDTGMPVTVHYEGTPRDLDPSIGLAAYRIVQEGLTNVLKHAGMDSHPQLRIVWEANRLRIQIDNDINVAEVHLGEALTGGRGLVGLRARATAAGGDLRAGPHHHGGYRLAATLPLPNTAQRGYSSTTANRSGQSSGDQGKVSA
jgi:signal transduction histidine kinase